MKQTTKKTIFMPKDSLEKWLKALRTREANGKAIRKINGKLRDQRGGFCAMGVLEEVLEPGYTRSENGLPTLDFLNKHGIGFLGDDDVGHQRVPYLPALGERVHYINDSADNDNWGMIADAIEKHAQPTDENSMP